MPLPVSVTSVPPRSGPVHGATSLSTTRTSSNCTPDVVKSRPLLLTSTDTIPVADELLHTADAPLAADACTTVPLKRHCR